jgi:hypothetical protein
MNTKNQELSTLKIESDRLRTSEIQYRLEVDRLKADLQCDQVKIQQLERELNDLKFERTNLDNSSTNVYMNKINFLIKTNKFSFSIESS